MAERPTIAFRVDETQEAKWKQYAEENDEYDSLSHLIRVAVSHEMSDSYGYADNNAGGGGQQVGEIETKVDKIEGRLDEMTDQLSSLNRAVNASGGVSEETLTKVFNALPTAVERATTAVGIAEGLDVDSDTVRVALGQLQETTAAVQKRKIEQVEEGQGTRTITTHTGNEIELEDTGTAVRRRNPLWWRRE